MVFFNYATMQMAAKIVYYGPGLCGKTTNLHHIYTKTSPQSRGEMVSLETETDRTLFFDLLPIDVGVIGGFKTRLQLYTIPGQVFYNTTRKLVLKGVDGVVFVADSQIAMLDANVESFNNLKENLAEIGLDIDDIPLVLQLNKRDLPNVATPDTIASTLDGDRKYEWVEAVAARGEGVFETLKLISKLTLRQLRRRMTGEEPVRAATKETTTQPRRAVQETGTFRVKDNATPPATPRATVAGTTPLPSAAPVFTTPAAAAAVPPPQVIVEPPPSPETPAEAAFTDSTLAHTADVGADALSSLPVAEPAPPPAPPPPPAPEPPPPAAPPEPEIDFARLAKPAKNAEVKHVKVRTSVDIMAELESLRKRATAAPVKSVKKEPSATELILAASRPKRDMHKTVSLAVAPGVLPKSKNLRFTVSFENEDGVVQTQEQSVELGDTADVGSLSVNVKFDI